MDFVDWEFVDLVVAVIVGCAVLAGLAAADLVAVDDGLAIVAHYFGSLAVVDFDHRQLLADLFVSIVLLVFESILVLVLYLQFYFPEDPNSSTESYELDQYQDDSFANQLLRRKSFSKRTFS